MRAAVVINPSHRTCFLLIVLQIIFFTAKAASADEGASLRLMTLWEPQAQFAGYYLAEAEGLFSDRGLEVTVIDAGASRDTLEELKNGNVEYALGWLPAALVSNEQVPLINLLQIMRRSNLALVAWKSEGIESVGHLDGRRISLWGGGFRPSFEGLFTELGIRPDVLEQYYSVELFLRRGVVACSVMHYNEFDTLRLAGVDEEELSLFFLRDYGFGPPEDGLYMLKERWETHPNEAEKVSQACMEGWRRALDNPEAALDLVMERVRKRGLPTNRVHMRWMLQIVLLSIFPEEAEGLYGSLDQAVYERSAQRLRTAGRIAGFPPYEAFHVGARILEERADP